ncbi:hypothetical protein IKF88_02440 [Candidatus Saccharibacteria bacterium]|nr:hypothetical protein [Candidatus Saccharibacteria bacterium]
MNQFLTEKNFWHKYHKAVDWTRQWTEPFDEFVRIARNETEPGTPQEYARVSDGTTASLIRKTPKRIIQQLPTGVVSSDDDNDWLPIVAEFILLNKIIPYANSDYDLIQKFWSTVENGLVVGGQAVYTPFLKRGREFTTDASLVYWGDIFFQPGKKSFYDCDYFFMRSWWQPETIDQILEADKKIAEEVEKNGGEYTSTWDAKALQEVKKNITSKDAEARTRAEERLGIDSSGIEVVMGFQKGVGAIFYTGCPANEGEDGTIVRRKKNKDPRGLPPVDYFYSDVDGSNPFGRSVIEIVGGMQNMIDADMRAYKFNRALGLAPPVLVYGNVDTTQAIYEANALVDMGDDPKNRIEPLSVDTSAIANYPNIYALNKTQLYALFNSGGDTTVSAEVGNPGFGKTPTALKQQKELMSADDNYIRKNFESFFENWAETAINVYFAEREGVEELQLDRKTADKLRELEKEGKLEDGFVDSNNKVRIDYSSATPALHFRVDASTSKLNGQSEQLEALQLLLQIAATPSLSKIIPQEKLAACWNKIVANSGVEDSEDLTVDLDQFETPAEAELAEETAGEPVVEPDADIEGVVSALRAQGVPDEAIADAIHAVQAGIPPEQVANQLERLVGNGR